MKNELLEQLEALAGKNDIRRGHTIDIVTRKDAVERRYEADWLKTGLPKIIAALRAQQERDNYLRDLVAHGTAVMRPGKHVPLDQFFIKPPAPEDAT